MKEKILFLSTLLFSLIVLFVPGAFDLFSVITKVLFEGSSYAKTALFLIWLVLLFGLAVLRSKGIIKPLLFKNSLLILIIVLGLCWFAQLQLNLLLFSEAEMPSSAIATVLVKEGEIIQWESTQLTHIHITKGALYNLIWWFPLKNFDSGYPMHNLLPFPYAIMFLLLAFVLGLLLINEFLKNEEPGPMILLAVASFGALVSIFDGGIFSIIGRITIGLLVAFILYKNQSIKSYQFFLAPFAVVATTLYLGSFLFEEYPFIYGAREILVIGIIASALLIIRERKILKPVWIIVTLYLIYSITGELALICLGAEMYKGANNKILIYGLPKNVTETNLNDILAEYGEVKDIELYNYLAFATIKPNRYFRSNELQKKLIKQLKPMSYLYVVKGWDIHRAIIKSNYDLNHLTSIDSDYISFRKEYAEGKEQLVGESLFPVHFMTLFVSNNLFFEKNIEVPVVFGMAK